MAKTIIGKSPLLPNIDDQIEYVKHLRKEVIPCLKGLQSELDMIFAIEQSLMAAKIQGRNGGRTGEVVSANSITNEECMAVLNFYRIKITSVRIDVLRTILSKRNNEFTVSDIYQTISKTKAASRSAVISTIILFKVRGLIKENQMEGKPLKKGSGRPEMKLIYAKEHV